MRLRWALPVALATAAVGLGLFAPVSAPAGCVGPELRVRDAAAETTEPGAATDQPPRVVTLRAGQQVSVRGRYFFVGCNDTGTSTGCSSTDPEPMPPAKDVDLTITQGDRSWVLGTADAGPAKGSYRVRWDVQLPVELEVGDATLTARDTELRVVIPD